MFTIIIDRKKCRGHALCEKISPEIWKIKNKKATFVKDSKSTSLKISKPDSAKRSALACPEYAIDVLDNKGKSILDIAPEKGTNVPTLKAHYNSMKEWVMDEKGFFTIKIFPKEGVIRVRCYNGKHKLILVIEGKTAIEIYNTIVREKLISRMEHAADLGAELQKAEIAMRLNIDYIQDSPLKFK